eukprot:g9964.t1
MLRTGQQQLGVGVMVKEKEQGALQPGRRHGFGGGSQGRDPGTPPLPVKPPQPAGVYGGDDRGVGSTLRSHDSDVELDRLWDRFNSLKGELPATSNTPPPAEHNVDKASGSETRRSGGGGGEEMAPKSSREEQEAWAHRREIAGKLEDIQRALAAKAEDGKRRQDELEGLYQTIEELEAYVELEASKRVEAECRAEDLEAGLHVLADRCDLEIAARETAESAAKRYMELIAEARAAWQKTQDIVQNKERELAAAESRVAREAGVDDLQRRLEDARRGKEMDRQHSESLKRALEGGAVPSPESAAAPAATAVSDVPPPKSERRRNVGGLVDVRDDRSEWRETRTREASSGSQPRLSLDPSRVAAAEARLQAAIDEAAAAAAATAATPDNKTKQTSPPPQQQSAGPKQSHASRQGQQQQQQQKQQQQQQQQRQRQRQQQRGDSEKAAPRPRIVPLTKDRPEPGGGDAYRGLGGAYSVATASSINGPGGSGPCTYSGTVLNHHRYYPKEASYVSDYFSAGDDERSVVGVDERYGESRPRRGEEKGRDSNRPLGVCREKMVKLKGTVGAAVVKAMNEGGKNMKVHDSKRGTELIAALCSISSGFAF